MYLESDKDLDGGGIMSEAMVKANEESLLGTGDSEEELWEQKTTRKTIQFFKMLGARNSKLVHLKTDEVVHYLKKSPEEKFHIKIDKENGIRCCPYFDDGVCKIVFIYETLANLPFFVEPDGTLRKLIEKLGTGKLGYCSFAVLLENGYLGFLRNNMGPTLTHVESLLRSGTGVEFAKNRGVIKIKPIVQQDTAAYIDRLTEVRSLEIKLAPQDPEQLSLLELGMSGVMQDLVRESCATTVKLILKVDEPTPAFESFTKKTVRAALDGGTGAHKPEQLSVEALLMGEADPRKIDLLKEEFKFSETFHLINPPSRSLDPEEVFKRILEKYLEMESEIKAAFLNFSR